MLAEQVPAHPAVYRTDYRL